jgi:hypothetical protein
VESQDNDDLIAVEQLEGIYTFANNDNNFIVSAGM